MSDTKRSDPFADLRGEYSQRLRGDRWGPEVDVFETDQGAVVRVEIAGVRSEDIQVSVDGQTLHIRGVRRAPEPADVRRLHQMEIATGPFERRVSIPIAFERERVSAHLADGFLTVTLPRRVPARRRVELES